MNVIGRPYDVDVETLARITPYSIQAGRSSCPAWLHHQLNGAPATEPFFRWEIRNRLLLRLREAHGTMRAPEIGDLLSVPGGLLPEQAWFYRRYVETYCDLFAGQAGETRLHGCEVTSTFERRQLRVGGAVDLLLTRPDGLAELRQFELWGGRLSADPHESWEMGLAVLRLYRANPDLTVLLIRHADLLSGEVELNELDLAAHVHTLAESLDEQVDQLRARAAEGVTTPGRSCRRCDRASTCGEWTDRPPARPRTPDPARTDYVGSVVKLTPTSLQRWLDCPRAYRAAHLLDLPSGPLGVRSTQGLAVHACLARLHEEGPCGPDAARHLEAASIEGCVDDTMLGFITRHARRCPPSATSVGHELDLAQLHTWGEVPVMVTARVDAVWQRDGLLDCRDYKTGRARVARVADDPGARIQAWLLARLAAERGLRLQLRYEHLVPGIDEDPEPFEPDAEDIANIEEEIGEVAAAIASSEFHGISDPMVCRRCTFRHGCPDALLEDADDEDVNSGLPLGIFRDEDGGAGGSRQAAPRVA